MSSLADILSRELTEKAQEWISEQVAPAVLTFCQQQGLQHVTLEQIVQYLGSTVSVTAKAPAAARASKPLLTPEKAQQLMDPNFDDKFNPQGCFYFTTTRGAQPFTFCGVSGAQVCQSCAKKAEGKRINKDIADGNFDAYKLREKVRAARLAAATKRLGDKSGAASSAPLDKSGNPIIETPPPASAGASGVSTGPAPPKVRRYKGPVNSNAPHFITTTNGPLIGLVFKLGDEPNSKDRIVLGLAAGVDSPMRKLTGSEADACRAAGLTLDLDALEGSPQALGFLNTAAPVAASSTAGGLSFLNQASASAPAAGGLSFLNQAPAATTPAAAGPGFLPQIGTMPAFPSAGVPASTPASAATGIPSTPFASAATGVPSTPFASAGTGIPSTDEEFF